MATEDGSETNNEILHNFVMRTNGGTGDFNGLGVGDDDFGDLGDAFWFAGPMNSVRDNVATNIYRTGFVVYPNNISSRIAKKFREVIAPKFPGANMVDDAETEIVNVVEQGVQDFQRNEVYGTTTSEVNL